jgi:hypothetical protein
VISEPHPGATYDPGATAAEQAERASEMLTFMVIAFGAGLTIGLFFLIFIALAYARWL